MEMKDQIRQQVRDKVKEKVNEFSPKTNNENQDKKDSDVS